MAANELAWRAAIAAGYAGHVDTSIVSYTVTSRGADIPVDERSDLAGELRSRAGGPENGTLPRVGTLPDATIRRQLQSNLRTLKRALPQGLLVASSVTMFSLRRSAHDDAIEVDLKVRDLARLRRYVGDLVDGLGTGLTGGPTAPTEGLAVGVVDSHGRRAGWWSAGRAGSGSEWGNAALPVSGGSVTTRFQNLTGGPAPTGFSSG